MNKKNHGGQFPMSKEPEPIQEKITNFKVINLSDSEGRVANIEFENGSFSKVVFNSLSRPYNRGDWAFLGTVTDRIQKEEEKHHGKE